MSIAIITGASSGLGLSYVDAAIREFPETDEIWLIARHEEKLNQTALKHKDKKCVVIPMDMSDMESFSILREKLETEKPEIRLLINDAGMACGDSFERMELDKMLKIIDLNCKGATAITRICLPYISDGGTILEVSSTSAFVPNTGLVVYSASKSYVQAMCIGLREELKHRKINVCAMCPGMMMTDMNKDPSQSQSRLPKIDIDKAAVNSLRAAKKGRAVYTTEAFYKLYRLMAKLLPQTLLVKFAGLE